MTGNQIAECRMGNAALKHRTFRLLFCNPKTAIRNPQSRGFTLLELMIVISIIIILAVIVLPSYQRTVISAREAVLRDDLFQMRKMLDQYAADKGRLPSSLDELVSAGYLREIPVDPITDQSGDWVVVTGSDPNSSQGGQGITDVHCPSQDRALDGSTYDTW